MTKVAVVEDDTEIRKLLEFAMQHADFEVVSASNGKRGLDVILRERPKVVILDVKMPGMSGFEVCHAVKQLLGPHAPYVIMLTARSQTTDIAAGRAHGADLYLIKPVDMNTLLKHVRNASGESEVSAQAS